MRSVYLNRKTVLDSKEHATYDDTSDDEIVISKMLIHQYSKAELDSFLMTNDIQNFAKAYVNFRDPITEEQSMYYFSELTKHFQSLENNICAKITLRLTVTSNCTLQE